MFGLTTIIIICIFLLITYFIYQLLIDNLKMTKKIEDMISNKVDEVFDKINDTCNLINKKTDNLLCKIKEYGEIELKKNELDILNNQKIVEKHIFQDEEHCGEHCEVNSPITENFFIKRTENKENELYYMSPVIKTSKNSNILSITSKESLFKDIHNDTLSQKSSIIQLPKLSKSSKLPKLPKLPKDLYNLDDDVSIIEESSKPEHIINNDKNNMNVYDNNIFKLNFLNNNSNYYNNIENKNENDSMKIRDEDRVEEL